MKAFIEKKIDSINIYFAIGISIICFCFLTYKATYSPLTHDECITFTRYTPMSVVDIIRFKTPDPNNHILFTLSMKFCAFIFGNSELSLRLPSLFCFSLYAFYTFLILKPINKIIFIPAYALLFANPFLLDFFFLARGYGMAIAIMVVSIYHFINFHKSSNYKSLCLSVLFAALSAYSNFGLLNFLLGLMAVHNLIWLFKKSNSLFVLPFIKYNLPVLICIPICILAFYHPLNLMIKLKLALGGDTGFYSDTVDSLLAMSNYNLGSLAYTVLNYIVIWAVVANIFSALLIYRKHRLNCLLIFPEYSILTFLIIFIIAGIILQHKLFGTPYVVNRYALFLTPLFWLTTVWLLNSIHALTNKVSITIISYSICAFCVFHTINASNTKSSLIWKYDIDNKTMLQTLENISKSKSIRLGASPIYEPSINYYRNTKKLTWLNEITKEGLTGSYNFYYARQADYDSLVAHNNVRWVQRFEPSGSYLVEIIK